MNHRLHPSSRLGRALAPLARTAIVLFGVLLTIGALMLGMALAVGFVLWTLLRGRRTGPVSMRRHTAPMAPRPRRLPMTDVVDVQARDVEHPKQR